MMRRLTMGSVLIMLAACGGSGDDDGGTPLEGDAAVQAAAQVAVSLTGALEAILDDPSAGLVAVVEGEPMRDSRAIEEACDLGGSVDSGCREDNNLTFVTADFRNCTVFDTDLGLTVTADGETTLVFEAINICGSFVPDNVASTLQLRGYREEWRSGSTLVRVIEAGRFDQVFRPDLTGCSANDGEATMDGDLRLSGIGFDWVMRMDDLHFTVSSQGNPCDETALIDGVLEVDDGARASRFTADLEDLQVVTRVALDGVLEVALDGGVDLDCLGRVDYSTGQRLALLGECPVEGEIGIVMPGREPAAASFTSDGVLLDYDSDGFVDFEARGCGADSLATCR